MRQQAMRKLGDREHEHQIEEQFDIGDAAVLVAVPRPQMIDACRKPTRAEFDSALSGSGIADMVAGQIPACQIQA